MDALQAAGIVQALLLGLYFLSRRREVGALYESVLLFCLGASIAFGYLYSSHRILEFPHLARFAFTLMAQLGPLFYLSVKARIACSNRPAWADLSFLAIPVGITLYLLPFHLSSEAEKLAYLREDLVQIHFDCIVILYFSLFNNLAAMSLALFRMWKAGRLTLGKDQTKAVARGNLLFHSAPFVLLLLAALASAVDPDILNGPLFSAVGSLLVFARSYLMLSQRESGVVSDSVYPPAVRYQKALLSDDFVQRQGALIDAFLNDESPYREPDFQLGDVAARLGLNPVQTSQIINRYYRCSFTQLVQERRVRAVLKRMEEYPPEYSLLDIALESGFNSKSAFNAAFRRITGETPSLVRARRKYEDGATEPGRPGSLSTLSR